MLLPRKVLGVMVILTLLVVLLILAYSWAFNTPSSLVRTLNGHALWVTSLHWSPDGKWIASASDDGTVKIGDVATGHTVATLSSFRGGVLSVAWSPDSKHLATASTVISDGVQIWNATNWQAVHQLDSDPRYLVTHLSWSPNGKELAISAGNLELWDIATEQRTAKLSLPAGTLGAEWSPSGKFLALDSALDPGRGYKGVVVVWDPSKGDGRSTDKNTITLAGHNDGVLSVSWSPDGKQLASGSDFDDSTIKIWNLATKQNTATFTGHRHRVDSVAWSPDGEKIASGSWDRTARIWDVATGQNLYTFQHPHWVTTIDWSPDSKYLATGDHSTFGVVRIWEVK